MNPISNQLSRIIELGRTIQVVDSLNDLAWKIRRNDINHAYQASIKSEEISQELNYEVGILNSLKVQGYCLWRFSDYPSSMEKSTQALKIAEKINDKKAQADILNNIGAVYMFLNDNENRLKCNIKCLELRQKINDYEGVAGSLNNIGETYAQLNNQLKAKEYFNLCLNYKYSIEDAKGWAYQNLGLLEYENKNYPESIDFLLKSINQTEKEHAILTCNSYYHLAINYQKIKELDKTIEMLNLALIIAEKMGARLEMKKIHYVFSEVYETQCDFKKAFRHYKKFSEIYNALYNEESANRISNLKNQFVIESLQKETKFVKLKNNELNKAFVEIENQKKLVETKNKSINDSIIYAHRIQKAIIENKLEIDKSELDYFKIFKPKDIVSGDFYWSRMMGNYFYLAVVDCTGHGVPGAFMSMLGIAFLNEIANSELLPTTNTILDKLRDKVISVLKQSSDNESVYDGMDMSIIRLDLDTLEMQYSGAMNSIYVIKNDTTEIDVYRADRAGIGFNYKMKPFSMENIMLDKGDEVYMFSDGYVDQFGGEWDKKVGLKNFKNWLIEASNLTLLEQKHFLESKFDNWKGDSSQIDDVCLIGFKV